MRFSYFSLYNCITVFFIFSLSSSFSCIFSLFSWSSSLFVPFFSYDFFKNHSSQSQSILIQHFFSFLLTLSSLAIIYKHSLCISFPLSFLHISLSPFNTHLISLYFAQKTKIHSFYLTFLQTCCLRSCGFFPPNRLMNDNI